MARAIACDPGFVFLDEPFAGLDVITKGRLLTDIRRLAETESFTVVLVTHDPLEVMALCSSAVVLNHGLVEEAGEIDRLLDDPQSEVLRAFGTLLDREHHQQVQGS